eukprot:1562205-Pyramimonas_sp.AAC.1
MLESGRLPGAWELASALGAAGGPEVDPLRRLQVDRGLRARHVQIGAPSGPERRVDPLAPLRHA